MLHKWHKLGREGLLERPGREGKPKWSEEALVFLKESLKKEPRTYNSVQLAEKLGREPLSEEQP